jgi:hypothetical protein
MPLDPDAQTLLDMVRAANRPALTLSPRRGAAGRRFLPWREENAGIT